MVLTFHGKFVKALNMPQARLTWQLVTQRGVGRIQDGQPSKFQETLLRFARALTATAAALAIGLTSPIAPAQAGSASASAVSCRFSEAKLDKPTIVVGTTKPVRLKVTAKATGCSNYSGGVLEFRSGVISPFEPIAADRTRWTGTVDVSWRDLYNSDAGVSKGSVYLDDGVTRPLGTNLTIKRDVLLLDMATGAKTVRKNKSLWVGGSIARADWEEGFYTPWVKKTVRVEFKPTKGTYKTIKKTRSFLLEFHGSAVETKVKLNKSGCLRLVVDATRTTVARTSKTVCVKVK